MALLRSAASVNFRFIKRHFWRENVLKLGANEYPPELKIILMHILFRRRPLTVKFYNLSYVLHEKLVYAMIIIFFFIKKTDQNPIKSWGCCLLHTQLRVDSGYRQMVYHRTGIELIEIKNIFPVTL